MDTTRLIASPTTLSPGPERLGRFIQACREKRGWSQAALARAAGVSPSYLSTIEAGQRNWPQAVMPKLAAALGLHEAYFAYEAGIITQSPDDLGAPLPFPLDDPRREWLDLVAGLSDGQVKVLVRNAETMIPLLRAMPHPDPS